MKDKAMKNKKYTKRQILESIKYWKKQLNESEFDGIEDNENYGLDDWHEDYIISKVSDALKDTRMFDAMFDYSKCNIFIDVNQSPECKKLFDFVKDLISSYLVKRTREYDGVVEYELKEEAKEHFKHQLWKISDTIAKHCQMGIIDIQIKNGRQVAVIHCDGSSMPATFSIRR